MSIYFKNLFKYKDLFIELIIKDIKLKYRNSILGVLWSMLNPLLMMVVLSIVFMTLFRSEIEYFAVYVLIGRIIYAFFSEATSFAMDAIHANGQLINKVYVPKYFFPLARVCSSFITSTVAVVPLIIMMAVSGMSFHWMNLLAIIPLIYLLGITAGIGLILCTVSIFFRDVKHFYSIVLLVLMYLTPIFYPISIIPERLAIFFKLNPLYITLEMFREYVMYNQFADLTYHLLAIIYMFLYLTIGIYVFYRYQDKFVQYI